jgi:hypothetical protein
MAESPLQIRKPCPKTWNELLGDGPKRFCSECSLHVHDASQLTRAQSEALLASATGRVCMRMQLDARGAPVFRDARRTARVARTARWAISAAAGLLAACFRVEPASAPAPETPSPGGGESTEVLGRVVSTEVLGDVAVPLPERLGEVSWEPPQPPAPTAGGKD